MNSCLSNLPKCFVCSFFHVDFKGDTLIFTCLFILFSLYDLANVVPTLAKFYHQASEAYEQACTRHISMIIVNVSVFLFFPFAKHYNICCTLNSLSFLLISQVIFLLSLPPATTTIEYTVVCIHLPMWTHLC